MLTIGDFSRLSRVTPRMLRHYDALGLLRPEAVGDNGYRYYRQEQLSALGSEEAAAAAAANGVAVDPETGAPLTGADIMEINTEKSMELRKTVRQFAQNNPEIAAQMVKAWLKGDDNG